MVQCAAYICIINPLTQTIPFWRGPGFSDVISAARAHMFLDNIHARCTAMVTGKLSLPWRHEKGVARVTDGRDPSIHEKRKQEDGACRQFALIDQLIKLAIKNISVLRPKVENSHLYFCLCNNLRYLACWGVEANVNLLLYLVNRCTAN